MLIARICCALVSIIGVSFAQNARQVMVNDVYLSDADVLALETYYHVQMPDAAYWYDPYSGLIGFVGGPSLGQILPGLVLGGSLRADASGGGTGVFFNGRELHALEVAYLYQLLGAVYPGRYWLDAQGNVGLEGGLALVNLYSLAASQQGGGAYTDPGPFGTMGSHGNCFYYNDPETGSSYMPPGC